MRPIKKRPMSLGDVFVPRYQASYTPHEMGQPSWKPGSPKIDTPPRSSNGCDPVVPGSEVKLCVTKPDPGKMGPAITSADDVCSRMRSAAGRPAESFFSVLLDVRNHVIGIQEPHRGVLTGVEVHPREVFRPAIAAGAAAIVVAHNHPSGDASPSSEDYTLTRRLKAVGELVGIPLLDHVIVGQGSCFSMAGEGALEGALRGIGAATRGRPLTARAKDGSPLGSTATSAKETVMAKHCVRYKRTRGGKRCAKYSGSKRSRSGMSGTKGKHCTRYKRTSAGRRCAKYA